MIEKRWYRHNQLCEVGPKQILFKREMFAATIDLATANCPVAQQYNIVRQSLNEITCVVLIVTYANSVVLSTVRCVLQQYGTCSCVGFSFTSATVLFSSDQS